eukprot:3763451-Amphidinium_carterae.3
MLLKDPRLEFCSSSAFDASKDCLQAAGYYASRPNAHDLDDNSPTKWFLSCLLYTSDAADDTPCVDL